MAKGTRESTPKLPPAESSRLIDFERADVISVMMEPPRPTLMVSGRKPWANMRVELVPLRYVRTPEYWGIEVVGSMPAIGQPAIVPYTVELDLAGVSGRHGIEVIGANKTERVQLVPTADTEQTLGRVEEGAFRVMYPPSIHHNRVRLTTVGVKDDVAPETGEIDLSPYEGTVLRVHGVYERNWIYSAVIAERASDSILAILAQELFPIHRT